MRTAVVAAALALAACTSEPEPAKSSDEIAQEQAEARERAKDGAFGTQIEALDKAAAAKEAAEAAAAKQADAVDEALEEEGQLDDDGG